MEKIKWIDQTFHMIDWESVGKYMGTINEIKQTSVVKSYTIGFTTVNNRNCFSIIKK